MNTVGTSGQDRRFFLVSAALMAVVVFVGFSRTFYLRAWFPEAGAFAPPEPFFRLHGLVHSSWMLFLVLQAALIGRRKVALHRKLGWFGAGLAALVFGLGVYGAAIAAARPGGFIGVELPGEQFFAVPFTAILTFAVFVALAITWRTKPQHHKRCMLLATIAMLEAAIIRFPIDFIHEFAPLTSFGPALLFVVALAIHDRRKLGRIHRVTVWGGLALALSLPLAIAVSFTDSWLAFSNRLIDLLAR